MERILLSQLRQLGDILLTTPAIRAVRERYPKARIDFLTHKMGKLILEHNPDINHLYTYHEDDSWWSQLQLMRKLSANAYDLTIDFMYNPRSALMSWMSRAPKRWAFSSRRNLFYTDLCEKIRKPSYIVSEKLMLLEQALGIRADQASQALILPWFAKDAELAQDYFGKLTSSTKPRVIISATHRRQARQWSLVRYAQIADMLSEQWSADVFWSWGPGEESWVEEAMSYCKHPQHKMPACSFAEMAALFANCDLFIGNSNGPSHVAVAVDIPSLQLHGPTAAISWCPCSLRHQAIQGLDMDAIKVEQVWRHLEAMKDLVDEQSTKRYALPTRTDWRQ